MTTNERLAALLEELQTAAIEPDRHASSPPPPRGTWTPSLVRAAFRKILDDAERDGEDVAACRRATDILVRNLEDQLRERGAMPCSRCGR